MEECPAILGQNIWEEEDPASPEKRVFQTILIQAIKDYITAPEEKKEVRKWVQGKLGTFKLCAMSMGMGIDKLQLMMLKKMNEVDRTHENKWGYSRAL